MNNARMLAPPYPALPCLSSQQLRDIEQQAQQTLPPCTLMERAGQAAATLLRQLVFSSATRVTILAGPGNNGGDGLVLARLLRDQGYTVHVAFCGDATKLPNDAARACQAWRDAGGILHTTLPAHTDVWVDALFGIALSRPITGIASEWIMQANQAEGLHLALDVPSGLNSDTGNLPDDHATLCFCADHTITFIASKPGLYMNAGAQCAGQVHVADLGLKPGNHACVVNHPNLFKAQLPARTAAAHKGQFGRLALVGGQPGMRGALLLAAQAALYSGAGRVYLTPLDETFTHVTTQPELMFRPIDTLPDWLRSDEAPDALVVGPGLGTEAAARNTLEKILSTATTKQPAQIWDADALNLLAQAFSHTPDHLNATVQRWQRHQSGQLAHPRKVLTPHPLEAARLLNTTVPLIQQNRMQAATQLAARYQAIIVLKGAGTVIAHPDGRIVINPTGSPSLATAGTGDVLAGLLGSLLAQSMPIWEATLAAVWLHGAAGQNLTQHYPAQMGTCASQLLPFIRTQINICMEKQKST